MAPLDAKRRDWEDRIARCRRLADLLRGDTMGARLAALAQEIEEQLRKHGDLLAVAAERRRHRRAMLAEIDGVLARARTELSLSRLKLDRAYSADDLREEARLCRDEAMASDDVETRRAFAGHAFELAMMGEAVQRKRREGGE